MARYKLVALTNAVAGREQDYNDWYDGRHLDDVLNVPGFYRAERLVADNPLADTPPAHRYMAIYEFETDDLKKTLGHFVSVTGTDRMPLSPALAEDAHFSIYRVLGPALERPEPTPWPD